MNDLLETVVKNKSSTSQPRKSADVSKTSIKSRKARLSIQNMPSITIKRGLVIQKALNLNIKPSGSATNEIATNQSNIAYEEILDNTEAVETDKKMQLEQGKTVTDDINSEKATPTPSTLDASKESSSASAPVKGQTSTSKQRGSLVKRVTRNYEMSNQQNGVSAANDNTLLLFRNFGVMKEGLSTLSSHSIAGHTIGSHTASGPTEPLNSTIKSDLPEIGDIPVVQSLNMSIDLPPPASMMKQDESETTKDIQPQDKMLPVKNSSNEDKEVGKEQDKSLDTIVADLLKHTRNPFEIGFYLTKSTQCDDGSFGDNSTSPTKYARISHPSDMEVPVKKMPDVVDVVSFDSQPIEEPVKDTSKGEIPYQVAQQPKIVSESNSSSITGDLLQQSQLQDRTSEESSFYSQLMRELSTNYTLPGSRADFGPADEDRVKDYLEEMMKEYEHEKVVDKDAEETEIADHQLEEDHNESSNVSRNKSSISSTNKNSSTSSKNSPHDIEDQVETISVSLQVSLSEDASEGSTEEETESKIDPVVEEVPDIRGPRKRTNTIAHFISGLTGEKDQDKYDEVRLTTSLIKAASSMRVTSAKSNANVAKREKAKLVQKENEDDSPPQPESGRFSKMFRRLSSREDRKKKNDKVVMRFSTERTTFGDGNLTILDSYSPFHKRVLGRLAELSDKRHINISQSDSIGIYESVSEGEIDCKCSVSSGEVHHCNNLDHRQSIRYIKKHPEVAVRKEMGNKSAQIARQRSQYNNWVTYFVHKNDSFLPDSSASSNLDL